MKPLVTDRLSIRRMDADDAAFILRLLNEPSWLKFIGDKHVTNLEEAREYIANGPMEMYETLGFGLLVVELSDAPEAIGLCGLLKREHLDHVDLGFAFLPEYWGQGYAFESAQAVMQFGKVELGLLKLLAITLPQNAASVGLLKKLGFGFERLIQIPPDNETLELYERAL